MSRLLTPRERIEKIKKWATANKLVRWETLRPCKSNVQTSIMFAKGKCMDKNSCVHAI